MLDAAVLIYVNYSYLKYNLQGTVATQLKYALRLFDSHFVGNFSHSFSVEEFRKIDQYLAKM